MMLISKRTQEEVDEVLNRLNRWEKASSNCTLSGGLTYEDGVEAAIRWLFDTGLDGPEDWPFSDEEG